MQKSNYHGHRAKQLADSVTKCFSEIVGNPPNDVHSYNSVKDIAFIMDSLNTMVNSYLAFKGGGQEERLIPAEFIQPIAINSEMDIEKVIDALDKKIFAKYVRCDPDENKQEGEV